MTPFTDAETDMNYDTCDYEGCNRELADWQPNTGAHLCKGHADEFEQLVGSEDAPGMVSFFMKTREEGSKRLQVQRQ